MLPAPYSAVALAAVVLLAGCFGPGGAEPASTVTVGGGSRTIFIVGVYEDRVYDYSETYGYMPCAFSDWRITFATRYAKVNGAYIFDTNDTREFSVKNDTVLLARLNESMREEAPVLLSWEVRSDRGCQYQHEEIVTNVTRLHEENATAGSAPRAPHHRG